MNKLFTALLAVLLFVSGVYIFRGVDLQNLLQSIDNKQIYIERGGDETFLPNWTEEKLLDDINVARQGDGFGKLSLNSKLSQGAKARISVVLTEDDADGTKTGITREKAVVNSGYEASLIGDLVLVDFFKTNNPIDYWKNNKNSKSTLFHPDFRDIGIAIKNESDRVSVYVIVANPRKYSKPTPVKISWGGVELWNEVNEKRIKNGVNPLKQKDELCTVASIRLNQLLELGKLDGHAGFVPVLERPDLKWITEKYNVSEFLIQGYPSPSEAVNAWENTMGHRSLLKGGEFVWGCVYSQNTFGVAIAAY